VTDKGDPALEPLAERALEVLVTHNEAVSRADLACALGVSSELAWEVAARLRTLGRAVVDEGAATVTAT
jgi:biotin operon repressor